MNLAFSLRGVSKRYDPFELQALDLDLPEGQIMGLVGVNGAGKTTLLRLLSGLTLPDTGRIEVLQLPMPEQQVRVKQQIGLASEDMRLYGSQSLAWHMDFIQRFYPAWDAAYAQHLMQRFDLRADQKLAGCSHGQRVKALLLLTLARRPRLLLLDEPTTGLDPIARAEVLEALADVLQDERRSVLFSSHQTQEVERLADRIGFLHMGRLLSCEDKESYLGRWRRLVGQGALSDGVQRWPEVAQLRRSGSLLELRVRDHSEALMQRLGAEGLQLSADEPMSLEEIFVTTVRSQQAAGVPA
ncbi:ABC-2 type transport system ATP-binding protein [Inhella inkyongensis]|uniref:ABC-2 type transport system ATP-binding protein n=1 Tax=Inhella inkyongensis TaxID=392593 RepID=A0A840RX31_9BURK|nr:ABC transporter ATP-binding protein [Inhella inkyongensis]MBB5203267.1 ABC-2 type transport system ATP-binding protein [Inhella inkyongensis]